MSPLIHSATHTSDWRGYNWMHTYDNKLRFGVGDRGCGYRVGKPFPFWSSPRNFDQGGDTYADWQDTKGTER